MRDIVWNRRVLDALMDDAMFDELTACVAREWAKGDSIVQTAMAHNVSTRTVNRCRRRIRDAYDAATVGGGLRPRKVK